MEWRGVHARPGPSISPRGIGEPVTGSAGVKDHCRSQAADRKAPSSRYEIKKTYFLYSRWTRTRPYETKGRMNSHCLRTLRSRRSSGWRSTQFFPRYLSSSENKPTRHTFHSVHTHLRTRRPPRVPEKPSQRHRRKETGRGLRTPPSFPTTWLGTCWQIHRLLRFQNAECGSARGTPTAVCVRTAGLTGGVSPESRNSV